MTVEYMLSDHLGSISLTADTSGAKVLELRYKDWGEVRATWTKQFLVVPDLAWMDRGQGEGHEFLNEATQVKNIWVPTGE